MTLLQWYKGTVGLPTGSFNNTVTLSILIHMILVLGVFCVLCEILVNECSIIVDSLLGVFLAADLLF